MCFCTKPGTAWKPVSEGAMEPPLAPQYNGEEILMLAKARRALQVSAVQLLLTFMVSKTLLLIAVKNLWIPVRSVVIPLFFQDKVVNILMFKKLFQYYSLQRKENELVSNVSLTQTAMLMLQLLFSILIFFVAFASVLHFSYCLFFPVPVSVMHLGFVLVHFTLTVIFSWFVFWFNLM